MAEIKKSNNQSKSKVAASTKQKADVKTSTADTSKANNPAKVVASKPAKASVSEIKTAKSAVSNSKATGEVVTKKRGRPSKSDTAQGEKLEQMSLDMVFDKTTGIAEKHEEVEVEQNTPGVRIIPKEEFDRKSLNIKKRDKKKKEAPEIERFVAGKAGLTSEQVALRVSQGLTNHIDNKNTKTYKRIFFSNIFTFFNLLCFVVAGALIYVRAWTNLLFLGVTFANMFIGIYQEIKAKKTIEKITLVTAPTARVIRDKKPIDIPVSEVVLDDIVEFSLGKQVCADSVIIDGEVEVNESLLTGESVPIKKKKGDIILSGSFIASGKCLARCDRVGNSSYTAELAAKAKAYARPKSELLHSLQFTIKCIGVIIVPLAILMFYNNMSVFGGELSNMDDVTNIIKRTAGSIIGMIPSGMFLLTSLALATGVVKLAKKRTLVQDLYSIEMLARADVLCLDKTGTITDGTMKVNNVVQLNSDYAPHLNDIIGSMLTALDDNNQTSRALATHFGYSKEYTAKEILPFSSSRKLSAVTFKNGDTFAFGAPEFVYRGKDPNIDKQVKAFAQKGFRVLLLVKCKGIVKDKLSLEREPIAIIVIQDHIREDAFETISWFKENNVEIKIISGDNPITVSEVSKRVGVENADKFISLEGLSEQQVIDASTKYTVFGRVSPEQKCILVKALKSKGHKVAMTGDGVNDILALKEADCSIAMASGSEATRNVSHLVLLDSNFSSMPSVVAEGRRVVNNVQKSSSLFLMKTLFFIFTGLFCCIVKTATPFNTMQMMLLEVFVIGLPSFFLALQPNKDKIKGNFMRNLISKSLPGAIIFTLNVIACYIFDQVVGTNGQFITMSALIVTFSGLLVLYYTCQPFDVYRAALFGCMLVGVILILTFVPFSFFEFTTLSLQNVLFMIVMVQLSYPLYSSVVKVCDRINI